MKTFVLFLLSMVLSLSLAQDSVPQKLADTPKDQVIKIKAHNGNTYCYSPNFTKGFGYLLLSDCNYATPARYDVFQRISWKVKNVWMCLTAPASVTGIGKQSTQTWYWLLIEPCSLNDENQRWILKDNGFHTADGRFRIKDYEWYGLISKKSSDYFDHSVRVNDMNTWLNTIAQPGTLSFKTFLGWSFVSYTPPQFAVYYIQNDESFKDDVKELFYNPENGHFAQFEPSSGKLYCMTSKHGRKNNWDWVAWEGCTDEIPQTRDGQYWEFFSLNENEGTLRDRDGNFLRVTQYGSEWGVPYTVKPEYLEKDTSNAPKSLFVFSKYVDTWNRYINANLGESLLYCPAPGNKFKSVSTGKTRSVRSLPPSFRITEDWIRRFWNIAITTQKGSPSHISFCGICMLHTYQMVEELHQYYLRGPLQSGGYFFNTQAGVDPFISFRQRFPELAQRLEGTLARAHMPFREGENVSSRTARAYYAMALTMLPNYRIVPSRWETNEQDIRTLLDGMFNAPVGTMWIIHFLRTDSSPSSSGHFAHGQPVLRTPEGLFLIPTNAANASYPDFRTYVSHSTMFDTNHAVNFLATPGEQLEALMALRVDGLYENTINMFLSNNNCTGLGDDRRGNRRFPSSLNVNQCGVGRCAIQ